VARAIDPTVLRQLTADLTQGSIVITGTNGKTTTARLLATMLEGVGQRVVANRSGANLIFGATAAALRSASPDGRLRADWGVFEIDEASLPRAIDEIQPRAAVVLNLFRDQLDRYGELEKIAKTIETALARLPAGARAVLNADDPRVGEIGLSLEQRPLWFGIEDTRVASKHLPHAADARTCPRCGASLKFSAVYLGHDGLYRCPNGDFARPNPEITAADITVNGFDSLRMTVGQTRIDLPAGGLYNAYNALAAFATGGVIGLEREFMAERMHDFKAAFGRQERLDFRGRHLVLVLSKNPAGFNETIRTAVEMAGATYFVLGLNDRKADGTDVSWIWDVDFEQLRGKARVVIPAGSRAHDLAVRLKYAGVDASLPQSDVAKAIDQIVAATPEGANVHLLCTYTAMLDIRAELVRRGSAKPYWET
jgi:UDP-N-acetylmuramyl tripeptide synthase